MESPSATAEQASPARLWRVLTNANIAVIADTINFETLSTYDFSGTVLTPANIVERVHHPDVYYHVWVAVRRALAEGLMKQGRLTEKAMDQFLVELGAVILDRVPGPHITLLDPRLHSHAEIMVLKAQELVDRFEDSGIPRGRLVISIPATAGGLKAAQELEAEHGIQTNLTLVTSLMHAAACAEAGASTATISVGPLLEWHEARRSSTDRLVGDHAGITSVQAALLYYQRHNITTKLIGAHFREIPELALLGGFDAVSLTEAQAVPCTWSQHRLQSLPPAASPPWLRARQATPPVMDRPAERGYFAAMSAATRGAIVATMEGSLQKMQADMATLQGVVHAEVKRQVALETVDLKQLYRRMRPKRSAGLLSGAKKAPATADGSGEEPAAQAVQKEVEKIICF